MQEGWAGHPSTAYAPPHFQASDRAGHESASDSDEDWWNTCPGFQQPGMEHLRNTAAPPGGFRGPVSAQRSLASAPPGVSGGHAELGPSGRGFSDAPSPSRSSSSRSKRKHRKGLPVSSLDLEGNGSGGGCGGALPGFWT
eukprot:TRINITY_DN12170_c0_g1_i4.p1 TRINITY_DN12170_c0_g1~~TRINITY_DN12170_c0_g1_i4.p1  ORF type:complete len:140 (-),score=16.15 TRINITY_DN12170_c0_g1_i4:289-708(-)